MATVGANENQDRVNLFTRALLKKQILTAVDKHNAGNKIFCYLKSDPK
jgi:hypothetical protein